MIGYSPVASGLMLSEMRTSGPARQRTSSWSPNERSRRAYRFFIREATPVMTFIKLLPLPKNAELRTKP